MNFISAYKRNIPSLPINGTSHSTELGGARSYMELQLTLDLITHLNAQLWYVDV